MAKSRGTTKKVGASGGNSKSNKTTKNAVQRQVQTSTQTSNQTQSNSGKSEEKESLTVDGSPYAPISIRKTIEHLQTQGHFDNPRGDAERSLTVLIDNSGNGFDTDNSDTINVTIAERITQTEYFIDHVFDKLPRIPAYLYRYISWIMFEDCAKPMKYPRDNDYVQALASGILKQTDEEYQRIYNFIKWGKSNTEAKHLIGLIQLVGGTMLARSKKNLGCRFFIELPETGFHPKRERLIVSFLYKLQEEYGIKKDWTPI